VRARTNFAERDSSRKLGATTIFERNRAFERASTTCILKRSDSKRRECAKLGTKSALGASLALLPAMNSEGKSEGKSIEELEAQLRALRQAIADLEQRIREGKARQRSENSSHHDGAYNPDFKRSLPPNSSADGYDGHSSAFDPRDA
jgi:hypothetical protein